MTISQYLQTNPTAPKVTDTQNAAQNPNLTLSNIPTVKPPSPNAVAKFADNTINALFSDKEKVVFAVVVLVVIFLLYKFLKK